MFKNYFLISVLTFSFSFWAHGEGDPDAGENKVLICAGCHGMDGNSLVPNFPKLAGLGEKYITEQLRLVKSGERVIMEMMGILDQSSDQDLQDMAAYYDKKKRTIAGAKEIELIGITDPQQALKLGERIYRGGNIANGVAACTGCHSPSGNVMNRLDIRLWVVNTQNILKNSYWHIGEVRELVVIMRLSCKGWQQI